MKLPLLSILAFSAAQPLLGAITYVDATTSNTVNAADPNAAWQTTTNEDLDNLWRSRTDVPPASGSTVFQASRSENAPMLQTTVSGLTPNTYDVYVYYVSKVGTAGENWAILAGLSSSSLALYDNSGTAVNSSGGVITSVPNADQRYRALIGQAIVGEAGLLNVFIDDTTTSSPGSGTRSVYDGIGFEAIPEPSAALLGALGALTLLRRKR